MLTNSTRDQFLKTIWKEPNCYSRLELPNFVARWLLYQGSFTKKARTLIPGESIRIEILQENLEVARKSSYEFQCFNCHYIYTREIKIYLADYLLMFARSVMPKNAPLIFKRQFRGLGQRPLGHLLFASNDIQRSAFEIAKIRPVDREFKLAILSTEPAPAFLWGRRSVFSAKAELLLLTEIFSPDLIRLIIEHEKSPTAE